LRKQVLFSTKRTLRCMKNEAACGYEAWLCHTEKPVCASLHGAMRRFIRAQLHRNWRVHHIGASRCFVENHRTSRDFMSIPQTVD